MVGEPRYVRQLSRRRVLRSAALGATALAGAAVLGCKQEEKPAVTQAERMPKRGGTFIHGGRVNYPLQGLSGYDPHAIPSLNGDNFGLFYQTFLGYQLRIFEVQPEIAQKWEQPSETEYIFALQPGVKWHNRPPVNGRELGVEDVVFSLNRVRTDNARFLHRGLLGTVDKIEPRERTAVRITTRRPDAALLSKLSAEGAKILAPEVLEAFDRLSSPDHVIGTGPFILVSAESGVGAEVVRNPEYWRPGLPYLDRLRAPHFADDQVAYAAFLAGQVDVAHVPGNEVKRHIARQGPAYTPDWFPVGAVYGALSPNTAVEPFADARVWRALRLLIDHEEMRRAVLDTVWGRGKYGSIFSGTLDTWDLSEEEYARYLEWKRPKDEAVRQALALLSAAGFERTNPLKIEVLSAENEPNRIAAPLMQAQWRQLTQGVIEATIQFAEQSVLSQRRARRQFAYLAHVLNPGIHEPDVWLSQYYRSDAGQNYSGWGDPHLDDLIDKQGQAFNSAARQAIVREIILYMIEHSPFTVAGKGYSLSAAKPAVRDWAPDGSHLMGRQYDRVWLDTERD